MNFLQIARLCLCQQFFVFPWPMLLARCEPVQRSILSFQMVDRLFLEAYPRDEYQINSIKERFACEFETDEVLVQFDLQVVLFYRSFQLSLLLALLFRTSCATA